MNEEKFKLISEYFLEYDKEVKKIGKKIRSQMYPNCREHFETFYDLEDNQIEFAFFEPSSCGCCGDENYHEYFPLNIIVDNNLDLYFEEKERKKKEEHEAYKLFQKEEAKRFNEALEKFEKEEYERLREKFGDVYIDDAVVNIPPKKSGKIKVNLKKVDKHEN